LLRERSIDIEPSATFASKVSCGLLGIRILRSPAVTAAPREREFSHRLRGYYYCVTGATAYCIGLMMTVKTGFESVKFEEPIIH
jgi:hypothetical protein